MDYKRILTIQDISCVGQCSLTVALPILSACGLETCILPSAVLSTHTGGKFSGFTFHDLTEDIPAIRNHWLKQGISFDAIYTGYLGSTKQISYVSDIFDTLLNPGGKLIVDPAMADFGKLYVGFDLEYVDAMRKLCAKADVILPNITEGSLLTGMEYREPYDREYIEEMAQRLHELGMKNVIITGASLSAGNTGALISEPGGDPQYYQHERVPRSFHGTGDIYASAFTGALVQGKTLYESAQIAADFTFLSIQNTLDDDDHWYGVKFEKSLPRLAEMLK